MKSVGKRSGSGSLSVNIILNEKVSGEDSGWGSEKRSGNGAWRTQFKTRGEL